MTAWAMVSAVHLARFSVVRTTVTTPTLSNVVGIKEPVYWTWPAARMSAVHQVATVEVTAIVRQTLVP
jgi:hypothetical protein